METTTFFLDQNIPIPFPDNDDDQRNEPARTIRDVVMCTAVPEGMEDVDIDETLLLRLDALSPRQLFEEISAVAKFSKLNEQATQGEQSKENYRKLGVIAATLVGLYRPYEPSRKRHGPNNPFTAPPSPGSGLSYQPGAMRQRTGKHR